MNKKISIGLKFLLICILLAGCDQEFENSLSPTKSDLVTGGKISGELFLTPMVDPIASLPAIRMGAIAFTIADKYAFVGTGYIIDYNTGAATKSDDLWRYDPNDNTWTQMASLPGQPRVFAAAFSIGKKGYVGTGSGTTRLKDFWEYNYETNSWTQRADFGGDARTGATGFSTANAGYIGTGLQDYTWSKDFWSYNPTTDSWSQVADLPGKPRMFAGSFVIDDGAYLGAGFLNNLPLRDFWKYNPATDSWNPIAELSEDSMPGHSGFFSVGKFGYVGGNQQLWRYDPGFDAWNKIAEFPGTMYNGVGFSLLGTYGYIGTGSYPTNSAAGNSFVRYSF